MYLYSVGSPYNPRISKMTEGIHIMNLSAERAEVIIALDHLTPEEIVNFSATRSTIEVGIATHQELLILLFRQRGVVNGWSDAPFDIRLTPPSERTPPAPAKTLIMWMLVEATTGVIHGLRAATVSAPFMAQVRQGIQRQLAQPFDQARHDALVEDYQARFTSQQLTKRAWRREQAGR